MLCGLLYGPASEKSGFVPVALSFSWSSPVTAGSSARVSWPDSRLALLPLVVALWPWVWLLRLCLLSVDGSLLLGPLEGSSGLPGPLPWENVVCSRDEAIVMAVEAPTPKQKQQEITANKKIQKREQMQMQTQKRDCFMSVFMSLLRSGGAVEDLEMLLQSHDIHNCVTMDGTIPRK